MKTPVLLSHNFCGLTMQSQPSPTLNRMSRVALKAISALSISALMIGGTVSNVAKAADLTINDGAVVKFGQDAGITVRDKLVTGRDVKFTSLKDDATIGPAKPATQTPAFGDWRGLKIDPSVTPANVSLRGLSLSYAGGNGGAALEFRTNAYTFTNLLITKSSIGIRATDSTASTLNGISFLNNQVGIEIDRNGAPVISGSEFISNALFGAQNKTPSTIVQATGNWWGNASGPNDVVANAAGTGDKVSTGINYTSFTNQQPLIACEVFKTDGVYTTAVNTVGLSLSCRNATEVRLAETNPLTGATFAALGFTQTQTQNFTLSPTAGNKTIYAEFRGAGGQTTIVSIPQPIIFAPAQPLVALTSPADGAQFTANAIVNIAATAGHSSGIQKVEFYAGATLLSVDTTAPYEATWDLNLVSNGTFILKAKAYAVNGSTAEATRTVTVARPNTDQTGPTVSSIKFGANPLSPADTITTTGTLSFAVADPSGVSSVIVKIDGNVINGGSLSAGVYSIILDFGTVANGGRILTIEATDTLNNRSTTSLNFTLNLPGPTTVPVITSPANNATVSSSTIGVSGTAPIGTQVQLYVDDVASGGLLPVSTSGTFSGTLNLGSEGTRRLKADARNLRGTTAFSALVSVTYNIPGPSVSFVSPAAGITITDSLAIEATASAQAAITNVKLSINGTEVATIAQAPYRFVWNVTTYTNGSYTLTAVATDSGGRTGTTTRVVTLQKAPPPVITAYLAEVTSITPAISYGQTPITISGRAKDRVTNAAVGNATLKVILTVAGFQRKLNIATDATGNFAYPFVPQAADAGTYSVIVVHPDETAQQNAATPSQGSFTINRLNLNTSRISLNAARGFAGTVRVYVNASAGTGVNSVTLQALASAQPSGSLPSGITINTSGAVNVGTGQSVPIDITFNSSAGSPATGPVILQLFAGDSGTAVRGELRIDYTLSSPTPALFPQPTFIEMGTKQAATVTATVALENKGLIAAEGVNIQLQNQDGSVPPSWIYLSSVGSLGSIDVGAKPVIQVTAAPPANLNDGIYNFKLRISSTNASGGDIPIGVSVTQSGQGAVLFKAADIYTNTLDANNVRVPGLAGAIIKLQNENVPSIVATVTTNAQGQVTTGTLPSGKYIWRASSPNHKDASGRVSVQPGITTVQGIFLDYSLVSVEFSVTETTIVDRYDINLVATFRTEVPAPVVIMEPLSVNIPDLQVGEEFTGELSISNYGLVRADNVKFTLPQSTEFFKVEISGVVPTELAAKQRIVLPFKITQLKALTGTTPTLKAASSLLNQAANRLPGQSLNDSLAKQGMQKAGGCYASSADAGLGYSFECANGDKSSGGAQTSFSKAWGSCGGGGSAVPPSTPIYFILSPRGDGQFDYQDRAVPGTPIGKCAPDCDKGCSCSGSGGGGPPNK
jgi:large repetitive protein